MNWKESKFLKWFIFFALFFFGLFCFMKDRGYCNECETDDCFIEEVEDFLKERVPVEEEYLYQYGAPLVHSKNFMIPKHEFRAVYGRGNNPPSAAQRKKWQEEYDNHHFHAVRTYNDAYDRVWWLPNLTWRQWGRDAWVAACAMVSTKTPCQALVVAFSTMLSQYGLHCADEWDYIEDKLYWSNYHFEQCAIYAQKIHG